MTFINQNILIACSDKKDRLQFFNYFDDLDAEKIFTASDRQQMTEMLTHNEENFTILAFEISPQWIQNIESIKNIIQKNPELKLVALVANKVNITPSQHAEIKKIVDALFFSPVTQQELLAKGTALDSIPESNLEERKSELESYQSSHFQSTHLPISLIDVDTFQMVAVNDAFLQTYSANNEFVEGKKWFELSNVKDLKTVDKLHAKLNEDGQLSHAMMFNFGHGYVPIKVHFYLVSLDGVSYYIAEYFDQTDKHFQLRFLQHLSQVTSINFADKKDLSELKNIIKWIGFDFCFIVNKKPNDSKYKIVWDCSLSNFADHFISCNHDFMTRKLQSSEVFEIKDSANKKVPGDEFLSFYGVNAVMAFQCALDAQSQSMLVVGGLNPVTRWDSIKLLFSQLALHYKQNMAFKALKRSHESESQYDVLTELLNRRYIVRAIEQSLEAGIQNQEPLAVLFLDLDRFKVINDSLGHDVGDEALINVAQILTEHVADNGVAARYAGDEFLVLLNKDVSKQKVSEIATAILKSAANPIKLRNGSEIKLTVSIGVSYFPEHGSDVNKLIKHADIALYNAKLNGKNRFTVYDSSLDGDQAKQSEEMVRNLQAAIELDQIEVYYQPKIDASTEDIMGFEALVRWQHPELGIISPGLFIPLAEQTDLIYPIGLLVIEKACVALKKWQSTYKIPLTMSINLSPIQLNDKDLTEKISHIIAKTNVYPKHLDFEITESEKFKSVKDALLMFKKIVNLGCTLSIDDFGTGHSTLDYLRKIPAKTLKIDQVFVKNIGLSPDDEAILDATIDMAKRVGHFIVAEGVETEGQRQYLTNKGCDYFQGYLFSRPLPVHEIDRILTERAKILKNN